MAVQFLTAIDLNGNKVVEMATPTAGTDGVNKDYVDNAIQANGIQAFAQTIGNGVATGFAITHNLNGGDYVWSIKDLTTGDFVYVDGNGDDADTLQLTFASPPATNQYRVLVLGYPIP